MAHGTEPTCAFAKLMDATKIRKMQAKLYTHRRVVVKLLNSK
jgi:hypothetical protein